MKKVILAVCRKEDEQNNVKCFAAITHTFREKPYACRPPSVWAAQNTFFLSILASECHTKQTSRYGTP